MPCRSVIIVLIQNRYSEGPLAQCSAPKHRPNRNPIPNPNTRLVVLESGLGLESGLKSFFAGLGRGLESYGLGLNLT